jgi:magnesium chelatase subunit D
MTVAPADAPQAGEGAAAAATTVAPQAGDRDAAADAWLRALQVAALFAVDPVGTGGVCLRGAHGPAREHWLAQLAALLPVATPWRRMPLHIADERLLGGLDLAATLRAGRPVAMRGVLAEADGGVVVLAMAERLTSATAARLCAVIDRGEVQMQRDGMALRQPARFGVVALDEGVADDEKLCAPLRERLAFTLDFDAPALRRVPEAPPPIDRSEVAAARALLAQVRASDEIVEALCAAAMALGVDALRASSQALRVACAAAALEGRTSVSPADAAVAAQLVLAPRATRLPPAPAETEEAPPPQDATPPEPETPPPDNSEPPPEDAAAEPPPDAGPLEDIVLEAALAAMPAGLLAALAAGRGAAGRAPTGGRAGQMQHSRLRGRPAGVRRGEPRGGARLNLIETLRAAAPWQRLRARESAAAGVARPHIQVRREDFHVTRFKQPSQTTTVFVVDASGSSALNRLAEAKGAVELLLADCYARRDSVAVLAFRGAGAELLLPPTRSLVRAKRSLAGLPGGGGTPLASAIDAAVALADSLRRRGETPVVVLLTDGRGNIARDGTPGRARAAAEALAAAGALRAAGITALLLDTSPQPQPAALALAQAMAARYLPLPHADARQLSQAVRAAGTPPPTR